MPFTEHVKNTITAIGDFFDKHTVAVIVIPAIALLSATAWQFFDWSAGRSNLKMTVIEADIRDTGISRIVLELKAIESRYGQCTEFHIQNLLDSFERIESKYQRNENLEELISSLEPLIEPLSRAAEYFSHAQDGDASNATFDRRSGILTVSANPSDIRINLRKRTRLTNLLLSDRRLERFENRGETEDDISVAIREYIKIQQRALAYDSNRRDSPRKAVAETLRTIREDLHKSIDKSALWMEASILVENLSTRDNALRPIGLIRLEHEELNNDVDDFIRFSIDATESIPAGQLVVLHARTKPIGLISNQKVANWLTENLGEPFECRASFEDIHGKVITRSFRLPDLGQLGTPSQFLIDQSH